MSLCFFVIGWVFCNEGFKSLAGARSRGAVSKGFVGDSCVGSECGAVGMQNLAY